MKEETAMFPHCGNYEKGEPGEFGEWGGGMGERGGEMWERSGGTWERDVRGVEMCERVYAGVRRNNDWQKERVGYLY